MAAEDTISSSGNVRSENWLAPSDEPPVFGSHASVRDDLDSGASGQCRGLRVADLQLQPQVGYALVGDQREKLPDNASHLGRTPEDVDHLEPLRDVRERRIDRLAVNDAATCPGVHGYNAIARLLKIAHDAVAVPCRVGTRSDHRDGSSLGQCSGNVVAGTVW